LTGPLAYQRLWAWTFESDPAAPHFAEPATAVYNVIDTRQSYVQDVVAEALRRLGLKATKLADATCGSIRLKLLKIGALVRISVRRVKIAMASGHPWQRDWGLAYAALGAAH